MQNTVLIALIVVVAIFILYQYDPTLFGLLGRRYEGFAAAPAAAGPNVPKVACKEGEDLKDGKCVPKVVGVTQEAKPKTDGDNFADLASFEGPSNFGSVEAPAGCYPRDQLTPSELLPLDQTSIYAQQNPMGPGSLKGKNFLSAGALIGVNTVGQSLRNANLQLRSEPPNPQSPVSIWNSSTISPDISHRPLEIGA